MPTAAVFNFRGKRMDPAEADAPRIVLREGEAPGESARPGDTVRWLNPNTGAEWTNLRVDHVYRVEKRLLVRGHVGRLNVRDGSEKSEQVTVLKMHCAVTKRVSTGAEHA